MAWLVYPVSRSRAAPGRLVIRVCKLAAVQRETATSDARCQAVTQALKHGDVFIDATGPTTREFSPVIGFRYPVLGQSGQLLPNLNERQPYLLGEDDKRDAPKNRSRVAAVACAIALGADQV